MIAAHVLRLFRWDAQPAGPRWLASLKRWFRSLSREAADDDLAVEAARRFGAAVLEAASLEDLDNRLHAVVADPEFYRMNTEALQRLDVDAVTSLREVTATPEMVTVLGEQSAGIVEDGGRYAAAAASAAFQLVARDFDVYVKGTEGTDPCLVYVDERIPTEVKRVILDGAIASASILAIAQAHYRSSEPMAPWLAHALALRFRDGLHQYTRFLASLPVEVPTDVIPASERFDLEELEEITIAREQRFLAYVREHASPEDDSGPQ